MPLPRILASVAFLGLGAVPPLSAQEYYADIRPVLVENCLGCHSDAAVGWSMEDPEEAYAKRKRIARMIERRSMPPWLAESGHQEYRDDLSLDEETLRMVRRWADRGFERGQPRPDPARTAPPQAFAPDWSLDVLPGDSYLPNQDLDDDYRCFVVDWPGETESFATGFRAVPGNPRVAHHAVVFAVRPEMADRFEELMDEEEGPGYQCFGGAVPDRLGDDAEREAYEARYPDGVRELSRANFWLAHWAPGMDGHRFPEGTGLGMKPGSALVVQMHYYTGDAPGEADSGTRLDFQVAPSVVRPAMHLAQTNNRWLAGEKNGSMVIPPGETVTYQESDDLGELFDYIASVTDVDPDQIEALEVHSANLHMHDIGHSGVIWLTDKNGRKEVLLSVPRWNLAWQRDFTLVEPKVFSREELDGAVLTVECTFRNPKAGTVYGGFGSYDEMCFNFSYVAVRVAPRAAEATGHPGVKPEER